MNLALSVALGVLGVSLSFTSLYANSKLRHALSSGSPPGTTCPFTGRCKAGNTVDAGYTNVGFTSQTQAGAGVIIQPGAQTAYPPTYNGVAQPPPYPVQQTYGVQ